MKRIKPFLVLILSSLSGLYAQSINDFETVAPPNATQFGSVLSIVANPSVDAVNGTQQVARIGRTSGNWFELFTFDIAPITVPANTTYYLHALVKYDASVDISLRYAGTGGTDVRPNNAYTNIGQWQDLVFAIPGGGSGTTVSTIVILPDLGFNNSPAGQILNNSSSFGYVDEFLINSSSVARTSVSAPTPASPTLANFDSVNPAATTLFGASVAIDTNPYPSASNSSANSATIGRTSTNWYEIVRFDIPDFTVLPNQTKYLHIAVNYPAAPVVSIRIDAAFQVDILPLNTYNSASNGQWQDLVFQIDGGANGVSANLLHFLADIGTFNTSGQILNSSTQLAYVDNIVLNSSATPLFTPITALEAITSYAANNTNPSLRLIDFTTAGVTGVTAINLAAINAAIDSENPAPTTLAEVQTVVDATIASLSATTTILANFDGVNPVVTTASGATASSPVVNSYAFGGNTSANSASIGRTTTNTNEIVKLDVDDFFVLANQTKYIHIAVNYPAAPVVSLRVDVDSVNLPNGQVDILPLNSYSSASNGQWQDLVFQIDGGASGLAVTDLAFLADTGSGQVLNNSTSIALIDEIILNNSATPLFTARTGLDAIRLYALSNSNPGLRLVDYTAAGVTGLTVGNIALVNNAIDTATPAPTTLGGIQAIVNQALATLSLAPIALNDFESIAPNNVVRYGSDLSIVANPSVNATNGTAKTARLSRTSANWFELFAFDTAPVVVPANQTYYLHAMVKYDASVDITLRFNATNKNVDGTSDVRPLSPYTNIGQWQDLVFAIPGGGSGTTVNAIVILPDLGFQNSPAGQILNNSTSFGYIDEFIINGNPAARTSVAAPALATTLANFEAINPTATPAFGAAVSIVANPYPFGGNTSANCASITRTSTNWFEMVKFDIPDFTVLPNENKYLHIAVNYLGLPQTNIRIDIDNVDLPFGNNAILPLYAYTNASNGQWQEMVFLINGGAKGLAVNQLAFLADVGNYSTTGQILNASTGVALIDNIVVNSDPAVSITSPRTGLQAITLFAASNTNPALRLVDYIAASVNGVTSANLEIVNAAIDVADPAPTNLAQIQAIVDSATSTTSISLSVKLNDFESVAPNNVVNFGSGFSIVANPTVNTVNATTRTARLTRTSANWFELFAFDTAPIDIPANTTYYLHALVKYDFANPDIVVRYDSPNKNSAGTANVRPLTPYTDVGQWQDIVFAIPGSVNGITVNSIVLFPDAGFQILNQQNNFLLNSTTSVAYIDELLMSGTSLPRTTVAAPALASTLANFDGINPTATPAFGAAVSTVANSYPHGGNTSANSASITRTGTNWFELVKYDIPDFTVLAGQTRYVHVAVNYQTAPIVSIRVDVDNVSLPNGQIDILPLNTYAASSNGHWQDLVFAISGGATGLAVNNLALLADVGNFAAPPAGQVLNSTTAGLIDNIIVNSSPTPLFTARTGLQAITLYATNNTNPTLRLIDYLAAGVTGVTANNLTAVNAAIDASVLIPTTSLQVQQLVNPFRVTNLTDLNNILRLIVVSGATTYRYEVTNLTTNVVSVFERTDSNRALFSLVQLQTAPASPTQIITYNTSYSIRVAVNNNGFVYGTAYTVTTPVNVPSVRLSNKYCGSRLTALNEEFHANPVFNAVRYRFRVNGPGIVNEEFISNGTRMILTNLTQSPILYGTSYSVEVQASVDGTTYPTPYGQVCTINTPFDVPTSRITPSLCGRTFGMRVGIQPLAVFGADAYFYEVSGGNFGSPVGLEVTNMANPVLVFNNVPGATLNQTYSVRVSVRINGVYPTTNGIDRLFGPSCTLSTPTARMTDNSVSDTVFTAKAFPNPFASHFSLDIESTSDDQVEMKVFDMIGRQLEVRKVSVSELSILELGRNYPSGVYNVLVSQGDKVKSLRLVKR